jgi:anti-anti-sigma regulatory factor
MARAKAKTVAESAGAKRRSRKSPSKAAGKSMKVKSEVASDFVEASEAGPSDAFVLPDSLDSSSASGIKDHLVARRGAPLVVDAGQVRRVGVQALQVLIAAAQTWQGDGHSYVVTNPSSELLGTLALVGLSREHLLLEGLPR